MLKSQNLEHGTPIGQREESTPAMRPEELWGALDDRTSPEGLAWLRDAVEVVGADPTAVRGRFPSAGREVGREPLDPEDDPEDVHAWTIDDAARALILIALGERVLAELDDLYRYGDTAERRAILRALPLLPVEDGALGLVDTAIRSNDTRLIAAALGPYATEHLDDAAYDQAVLKCVFCEVPIAPLDGLPQRARPETARMLAAFAHERIAAGRSLPAEVWDVIDLYPPGAELRAIEAEAESPYDDRRQAAATALSARRSRREIATPGGAG
jgi:hypothetical protein